MPVAGLVDVFVFAEWSDVDPVDILVHEEELFACRAVTEPAHEREVTAFEIVEAFEAGASEEDTEFVFVNHDGGRQSTSVKTGPAIVFGGSHLELRHLCHGFS